VTWYGWQDPAKVPTGLRLAAWPPRAWLAPTWWEPPSAKDDAGNTLKLLDLDGWSRLPAIDGVPVEEQYDTGERVIAPGTEYRHTVYFDDAPPTSKEVTVRLPVGSGHVLLVPGPIKRG
jgi:hypothetical protein